MFASGVRVMHVEAELNRMDDSNESILIRCVAVAAYRTLQYCVPIGEGDDDVVSRTQVFATLPLLLPLFVKDLCLLKIRMA